MSLRSRVFDWFVRLLSMDDIPGPQESWQANLIQSGENLYFANLDSTCFDMCHYNVSEQRLWLHFRKSEPHYRFDGVPLEIFKAFMQASSHGVFYHKNIKGRYRATEFSDPR